MRMGWPIQQMLFGARGRREAMLEIMKEQSNWNLGSGLRLVG